ncbi:MAG TPA: sodium:solute symporter [Saprospiraceae bacterium]|nr:sodium:solute symporter [Saprospiraceae bacterium]
MSSIDWVVLMSTLLFIVGYGIWKTRGKKDLQGYLKGGNEAKWWAIGISIMATQASAITFLSTPGQAYSDGMRFIQFYFGLPVAMIILSVTFIPIYYRLKVYTAYEYLESRFDLKTRSLAALLFLIQRGLAAGITIYAPSIILSSLLGWNLNLTNVFIGVLVILYTVSGGTQAVTQTQKQQMAVMMGGMVIAGILLIQYLPEDLQFGEALHVAGSMGKLNVVNFEFDLSDRYNFWSGMTAALFLFMSYFGTDQSQVQRYLSGRSLAQSRLGLIMNGLLKVPMQFIILFIGVLVFLFYQFNPSPIFFNKVVKERIELSEKGPELAVLEENYLELQSERKEAIYDFVEARRAGNSAEIAATESQMISYQDRAEDMREQAREIIRAAEPDAETNDKDYIFMTFVTNHLPVGLVGLLFAVMFSAAMSSTASELNALGSTTTIDLYKRSIKKDGTETHYLTSSRWFTFLWGVLAIIFATTASLFENLIQAVNLLGSLFYGTILGIFIVAFYFKRLRSNPVFYGALMAEAVVIYIHYLNANGLATGFLEMGFLWYNVVGCVLVVVFATILENLSPLFRGRTRN